MQAPESPLDFAESVYPEQLAAVLREARRHGGGLAEVYVENRATETIRLDGGAVSEIRSDLDLGAGIRVVSAGGRSGYAYTNVLAPDSLLEAARAAAAASGSRGTGAGERVDLRERVVPPVQWATLPTGEVAAAAKVDTLRSIDSAARSQDAAVRGVTGIHVDVTQDVLVANSEGMLRRDHRVRTRVTCRVTARRDGRLHTGFAGPGGGCGMELYGEHPPETVGVQAAGRALRALEGDDPPTGRLPVVLGSAGGGLLLHEACGHGLEGDGLSRESSAFAATSGQAVASVLVSAVDDPSLPRAYGSYGIDDAGTLAEPTALLEGGGQVGALTDAETAGILGGPTTANARRESYAHPPVTRMSNTFIVAGQDEPGAIIGDVRHGIYVLTLRGGDVNITTGEFAFTASEAFLIENGEVTRPLTGLTLLGNGPGALASVAAVGDDLAFVQALCSKDGQSVPVSYGSPTLLVHGLTVAGGRRG